MLSGFFVYPGEDCKLDQFISLLQLVLKTCANCLFGFVKTCFVARSFNWNSQPVGIDTRELNHRRTRFYITAHVESTCPGVMLIARSANNIRYVSIITVLLSSGVSQFLEKNRNSGSVLFFAMSLNPMTRSESYLVVLFPEGFRLFLRRWNSTLMLFFRAFNCERYISAIFLKSYCFIHLSFRLNCFN